MVLFVPDVVGKFIIELREDADVAAIVGVNPTADPPRVRGFEPAPSDVQGPGSYRAFVVVVQLDAPRLGRLPVQRPRLAVRCYGRTPQEAAALRWACSGAIHNTGPRVHSNGLGIYQSLDETGGEQEKDPDTQQPFQVFIVDSLATTQVVA
jgi:hypothetical protein